MKLKKSNEPEIYQEDGQEVKKAPEISIFQTKEYRLLVKKLRDWMILVALPGSFSAVAWSMYESHEKVKELDLKVKYLEDGSAKIDAQFERIEQKIDKILIKMAK